MGLAWKCDVQNDVYYSKNLPNNSFRNHKELQIKPQQIFLDD